MTTNLNPKDQHASATATQPGGEDPLVEDVDDEEQRPTGPSLQQRHKATEAAGRQKVLRTNITNTSKRIYRMMAEKASRHKMSALLAEVKRCLTQLAEINDFLQTHHQDPAVLEKQQESYLRYVESVGETEGQLQAHLETRQDEEASIITRASAQSDQRPLMNVSNSRHVLAPEIPAPLVPHSQRVNQSPYHSTRSHQTPTYSGSTSGLDDVDGDRGLTELLELQRQNAGPDLNLDRGVPQDLIRRIREWQESHAQSSTIMQREPDEWIDLYVRGIELPPPSRSLNDLPYRPTRMEVFSGQSLT